MALDITTFETLTPSRFITFTIPNPYLFSSEKLLRVAVLDSPIQPPETPPLVAAMFVPEHRESDWVFSTESGHLQLLLNLPDISRLILIGHQPVNGPDSSTIYRHVMKNHDRERLEESLKPLVMALAPKFCFDNGKPEVPILSYDDNVICNVVLEKCVGYSVGEMLVEDVEIESDREMGRCRNKPEFRRRLRFKRMPNLVQTEIRIVPQQGYGSNGLELGGVEFIPDVGVLVHPYLAPMVASLALANSYLQECIQVGVGPKVLCLGVGGGALLSFLRSQLGFEVVGVEMDQEVLRVARHYFGLAEDGDVVRVHVGDAIEFLEKLSCRARGLNSGSQDDHNGCHMGDSGGVDTKFDVIMVDLDSSDVMNGISAPPLEFVKKHVLLAARTILCRFGVLIINVIPPNRSFYETLINDFREVFNELYEINVGNEENFVLTATVMPVESPDRACETHFLKKLRAVIPGEYMDSMRRI